MAVVIAGGVGIGVLTVLMTAFLGAILFSWVPQEPRTLPSTTWRRVQRRPYIGWVLGFLCGVALSISSLSSSSGGLVTHAKASSRAQQITVSWVVAHHGAAYFVVTSGSATCRVHTHRGGLYSCVLRNVPSGYTYNVTLSGSTQAFKDFHVLRRFLVTVNQKKRVTLRK